MLFKATNYMITVVELRTFQAEADAIFTDNQRDKLSDFIAANPHFGDVIPGTGGVRKIRWSAGSKGKRAGARVIYYFRDLNMPVFLLAVYRKGEKMNLTMAERETMRQVVDQLVREYHARRWGNIATFGKAPA
jgi:mRNA-degrading endonuclease RelE of RelBE toxin-antitoxin system